MTDPELPPGAIGHTTTAVYLAMVQENEARRIPPSLRELAVSAELSGPGTVHRHIQRLVELGLVERVPAGKRTRRPTLRVVAHG